MFLTLFSLVLLGDQLECGQKIKEKSDIEKRIDDSAKVIGENMPRRIKVFSTRFMSDAKCIAGR